MAGCGIRASLGAGCGMRLYFHGGMRDSGYPDTSPYEELENLSLSFSTLHQNVMELRQNNVHMFMIPYEILGRV